MTTSIQATIRERVRQIETMPAIPAVFMPLLKLLGNPADVAVDEVVRLVSYDETIAAQCLRMAASPLFGRSQPPNSIKGAVISLGFRRVQTTLLTCCLGQAFPKKKWALQPAVFWRHSLGCVLVCRKFSEKLMHADHEKAYTAGLLHDIGFMVNCVAFSKEFGKVMETASREGIPLHEAELATIGFTHSETGRALAEQWKLADDIVEVIACHHAIDQSQKSQPLVALVHLSDLLCRMRDLGYGYYERQGGLDFRSGMVDSAARASRSGRRGPGAVHVRTRRGGRGDPRAGDDGLRGQSGGRGRLKNLTLVTA